MLVTPAAHAFAPEFPGRDVAFVLVLVQLMVMPDVLLVENYRTMTALGLKDTTSVIGLPYFASASGIFLLRQTFKTVPKELRRGSARRRLLATRNAVEGVCAAWTANISGVRAGVGVISLE